MKVNIYYGGRGVPDDPCLYVIKKVENVLLELRVEVECYNIYEHKNSIPTLVSTMRGVDGVIFATTVEWLGLGGYMTQFLDALWLYGDKASFGKIYMQPIVMSTTYGEREGMHTLDKAWETLGGLPCEGICAYVQDNVSFQMNHEYSLIIEKKAENFYRNINQKTKSLPTSSEAVTRTVQTTRKLDLSPAETENLQELAADEDFVTQQKKDIAEISALIRGKMELTDEDGAPDYVREFRDKFNPYEEFSGSFSIITSERKRPINIIISAGRIDVNEMVGFEAGTTIKIPDETLEKIVTGKETFQRAFSIGEMSAAGNIPAIMRMDKLFEF